MINTTNLAAYTERKSAQRASDERVRVLFVPTLVILALATAGALFAGVTPMVLAVAAVVAFALVIRRAVGFNRQRV